MVRNTTEHDPTRPPRDPERSDAQLDMLHSFAAKLNVLTDTAEIANAITVELRTIIDYHNCRVSVDESDQRGCEDQDAHLRHAGEINAEDFSTQDLGRGGR